MHRLLPPLLLLVVFSGCSRSSKPPENTVHSPVLASVAGRAITQADFDQEVARRRASTAPVDPEAVLQQLIERQAMLIKAEKAGISDSPEFKLETENRLIAQWLSGTFNKKREALSVSDEEVAAAFETRKDSLFRQGAQHRYAILYRRGRNVEELKATLTEGVASFLKDRDGATQKGRLAGFGTLAANHSEDTVSRYRGGDLGWFDAEKPESSRIPSEVLKAGAAQPEGGISEPLVAGDGVYVIMKSGAREPQQIAFKEAAPALRRKLLSEKRSALETSFKTGLLAGVPVERKSKPSFTLQPEKPLQPPVLGGGPR